MLCSEWVKGCFTQTASATLRPYTAYCHVLMSPDGLGQKISPDGLGQKKGTTGALFLLNLFLPLNALPFSDLLGFYVHKHLG